MAVATNGCLKLLFMVLTRSQARLYDMPMVLAAAEIDPFLDNANEQVGFARTQGINTIVIGEPKLYINARHTATVKSENGVIIAYLRLR